jgi:hypothetical protein
MGLVSSSATLTAALIVAGGITDVAGMSKAGGLASAIASWIATNAVAHNIPPEGTLTAAGAVVTGTGRISFANDGDDFGDALADSIPATDPQGIVKWRKIGNALHTHIVDNGRTNPTSFAAAAGVITGTGTVSFTTNIFDPTIAAELGLTDTVGVTVCAALGAAILEFIHGAAIVNGSGFASPPGGGLLTGVSTIT